MAKGAFGIEAGYAGSGVVERPFQTGGRCGSTDPSRSRWRSESSGDWAIPSAPGKLGRRLTKLRFSRKTTTIVSIASNSFGSGPSSAGAWPAIAAAATRPMSLPLMIISVDASVDWYAQAVKRCHAIPNTMHPRQSQADRSTSDALSADRALRKSRGIAWLTVYRLTRFITWHVATIEPLGLVPLCT